MGSSMVVMWRRYSAAEKKAYRARVAKRQQGRWRLNFFIPRADGSSSWHFFADGFGSRVPTARLNGDVL